MYERQVWLMVLALILTLALAASPLLDQNVKITPVGSHTGELCANDRAMIFEDPTGVRFLPHPFPATSSASFAVGLPSRGGDGVTSFLSSITPGEGRAFRPVARHPRRGTLQPPHLATYLFGPSLTASLARLCLRPLSALHLG